MFRLTNPFARFPFRPLSIVLALQAALPTYSLAQDGNVLRPYIGYVFTYDDNVLGLSDAAQAVETTGNDQLGDFSKTAQGGVAIDKTLGRQHITATLGGSKTRFNHFRQLDNSGRDLKANWKWQLGSRLQGNVGMSNTKALVPYVHFHELERNTRTQKHQYVDGSWYLRSDWRVKTGLARYKLFYDVLSQQTGNRIEDRVDVALDYLSRSGSTVGLQLYRSKGDHPVPRMLGSLAITNSYVQEEVKSRIYWRFSDKTQAMFSGGRVSRKHASLSSRDFSGLNTRAEIDRFSSGKSGFKLALWRETGVVDNLTTDYSLNTGVSIAPNWAVSEKIQLEALAKVERHDFSQSLAFLPPLAEELDDRVRTLSLALAYRPMPRVLVQGGIFHLTRNAVASNGIDFKRNGVTVTALYQF